ncbi:MAG: aldehyde dehydrogenase family protein, partial [Bacteroidetes bacterium]|nr:aldehyde dehydrogenase family protein [Bacteroidota bacterium]
LAELIQEADLPPGVVNIITGLARRVPNLVVHPLTWIKSRLQVRPTSARSSKGRPPDQQKVTSELLQAENIIFEDAPLDQAVEGIINGIYFHQVVCCAGSRLFVQEG